MGERVGVAPQDAQGGGERAHRVPFRERLEPGGHRLDGDERAGDERDGEDDHEGDLLTDLDRGAPTGPARCRPRTS